MNNTKKYNFFIFFSTLSRTILEAFSSLLLYKKGYSLKEILLFYSILYLIGIFTSYLSLKQNILKLQKLLLLSTVLFSISFIYFNTMNKNLLNLIIFSFIFSISSYSYHSMRHYLAINIIDSNEQNKISNILLTSYLATIISSYFSLLITKKFGLFIVVIIAVILSVVAIIPLIKFQNTNLPKEKTNYIKVFKTIPKRRKLFFFLEQFKVVFLSLQPLYLYFYVNKNLEYIGIFNTLVSITILIFSYLILRFKNTNKYFFYINTIFVLSLIMKINMTNKKYILLIAIIEGIGIKIYETYSLENIYSVSKKINIKDYLIISETIFCLTRSILCLVFAFISNLRITLYIAIIGIFLSGIKNVKKEPLKVPYK